MRVVLALVAAASLWAGLASAQASAYPPVDYAQPATWACWPGARPNACETDLTTTVIQPDGSTSVERFKPDPDPAIDCFYVYPTVSTDPGALANLAVEEAERRVVRQQFARFGAACRLYAPVYRQFTLTALNAVMQGKAPPGGPNPAVLTQPYDDVLAAWRYYLAHANRGRGVVLIGHSQGSGVLTRLIAGEIDGKADQARLVSAILMGTNLAVPPGKDVGGAFKSIPLCRAPAQLGCAIAYASFRQTSPPPANSLFGRPRPPQPGMAAACVNPARLDGSEGELKSYMPALASQAVVAATLSRAWLAGKTIETPFVSLPGMLFAHCAATPGFDFLAVRVVPAPAASPRASDILGDVVIGGVVQPQWGLHLIDANLAMGNLIDIVRSQSAAWTARTP